MSGAPPITDLAQSIEPTSPVLLLDAETGARQLLWLERDQQGPTPAERAIIGHVGANLENGRRYLVAMREPEGRQRRCAPAEDVFAAYRDRTGTGQLPVEARRSHMEALFGELEGFGVARSDLYLAWDFTTQSSESTSEKLLHMRDDAFEALGGAAPQFAVDTVDEPLNANIFRRIDGTFQVAALPDGLGIPAPSCASARTASPSARASSPPTSAASSPSPPPPAARLPPSPPAPHSTATGSSAARTRPAPSHVQAFASEHNFVVCGTDWTGFAEEDLGFVASRCSGTSRSSRASSSASTRAS